MSTSLLCHGFGLVGDRYVRTKYDGGKVIFTIRHKREKLRHPVCKRREVMMRGTTKRRFRTVPIGSKGVFFDLNVQHIECLHCGSIRQVSLGFADPRFSYTRSFERYAPELSKHMTIQDVAGHLSVSWDMIKEMQTRDLTRRFSAPCLKDWRSIFLRKSLLFN